MNNVKFPPQADTLNDNVFYNIDRTIRSYRQYAHEQLALNAFDITVDQWLVLKSLRDHPSLNQNEIAVMTFKDHASLTRIVELLVKKGYLMRQIHPQDRRRFSLTMTKPALKLLEDMQPVIERNRKKALKGLTKTQIQSLREMLQVISNNCQS